MARLESLLLRAEFRASSRPIECDYKLFSGENSSSQFGSRFPERRRSARRKTKGNRVLMFGRIRELALYRAAVLRDRGFDVVTPGTREEAVAAIRGGGFDMAVLSYTLSNEMVQELAELVREYCPDCPIIAISGNRRMDREIRPDEMVSADDGPAGLIAALRKVMRPN
jgi:hypothetical protein